jgi:hypothetical protein
MENISISLHNTPACKLNNAPEGKFNNKKVTTLRKRQYINLQDQPLNSPKTSKKLLSSRRIELVKTRMAKKIADTRKHKKTNSTNKQLAAINKNFASIHTQCMKSKDNLEVHKLSDKFLQEINTTYSEHNLPTKPQQKVLYKAYLNMSAHYLTVKPTNSKNLLHSNLDIKHNSKEFCDLIDCSIETDKFLKNNMNDTAYISAQMQQLVGKSCVTKEKNEFVYEKCLSIYNKPEPQQELAKAQKKRSALLKRDDLLDKKEQLQSADENIQNITSKLEYIQQKQLSTQKKFLSEVFNKRKDITNNRLDKMITSYINTIPKPARNIEKITNNIMNIIKDDMQTIKDNHLVEDVIMKRVIAVCQKDNEFEC